MSNLARVRRAIDEVWGSDISLDPERARQIIKQGTYTAREDPGAWAPEAEVVIHTESGIPNGGYCPREMEKWYRVSDILSDLYCEHINGAIIAVYKDACDNCLDFPPDADW
jgi:hypothetical protein